MTLAERLAALRSALTGQGPHLAGELRESELRFRQVAENIREVFFLVDPQMTRMFYISPGYAEIWHRSCDSLYADPRSFMGSIHPDDLQSAMLGFAPHGSVIQSDVEYRIVQPAGTIRWIRARTFPIRDEHGDVYRFAGIAEDITEQKAAMDLISRQARALEQANHRLALLAEVTGLLQTVVRPEEAAALVSGYLAQMRVGDGGALYLFKESRNYLDLLARWGDLPVAESVAPQDCWALRRGQAYRPRTTQPDLQCSHASPAGDRATSLCLPMMTDGGPLGLLHVVFTEASLATLDDDALFAQRMSEQLGLALANFKLREKLRIEAMQDPLTGLYNRRFLEVSMRREFARAARAQTSVGVIMLDVDHFKRFNDTHGHEAGDAALCQLGWVLTENCRVSDLACRFGGEELSVVTPGATREVASAWAERVLERVRDMQVVSDGKVLPPLTVSIGIAFFPEDGQEGAQVLQAADRVLYAAKRSGRDRCMVSTGRSVEPAGVGPAEEDPRA
jgi:diguanylate cyclase (GGDEF)-like protein/PAS domain S-box-containing protein